MPKTDGLTALREIKRISPATQVVILTSHQGDDQLFEAIKAGAVSYVLKTAGVDAVVESVRAAARGESMLDPSVAAKLLQEMRRQRDRDPVDQLSPREIGVLTALARGRSNKEIARELSIGEETVKTHVSNILSKLHLADRTQAAIYGQQQLHGRHLARLDGRPGLQQWIEHGARSHEPEQDDVSDDKRQATIRRGAEDFIDLPREWQTEDTGKKRPADDPGRKSNDGRQE